MEKRKKEYKTIIGKKMLNVVKSDNSIGMKEYTEKITVKKNNKIYIIERDYSNGFMRKKSMFTFTKDEWGFVDTMHYCHIWFGRYTGDIDRYSGIEKM